MARPDISIIAAMAHHRIIGRGNRLPWRLPADLSHFKTLTMGKPMIMGRRTWESLPGLLPGRRHIVVTRDRDYVAEGAEIAHSLNEAVAAAGDADEVMIVGGASLYAEALPIADRIYFTFIDADIDGDTSFPEWNAGEWSQTASEYHPADDRNPFDCRFVTLERISL